LSRKTKGELGREDTGEDKGQGSLWHDGGMVNAVDVVTGVGGHGGNKKQR
jgi:hypothetical protein